MIFSFEIQILNFQRRVERRDATIETVFWFQTINSFKLFKNQNWNFPLHNEKTFLARIGHILKGRCQGTR